MTARDSLTALEMSQSELFRPPAPAPNSRTLGLFQLLSTLKRNPLECWSEEHFTQSIATVRLPIGRAAPAEHDVPLTVA